MGGGGGGEAGGRCAGRGGDRFGAEEASGRIFEDRVSSFRTGSLGIAYIAFQYRGSTPNMSHRLFAYRSVFVVQQVASSCKRLNHVRTLISVHTHEGRRSRRTSLRKQGASFRKSRFGI